MTHYKLSKEELESFARKVYEEACYGYLDLKDSVCDGMVRDLLDGRKILPPIDTSIMAGPPPMPAGTYMGHGGGPPYTGGLFTGTEGTLSNSYNSTVTISTSSQEEVQWEINTDTINDIPVPMSAATGLDGPPRTAAHENEGIQLRHTSGHVLSMDDTVRPELNFQGNESERF